MRLHPFPFSKTSHHHHHCSRFSLFSSFLTFFHPSTWKLNQIHMDPTTTIAAAAPTISTTTTSSTTPTTTSSRGRRRRKIVVIMGPTGAGKSRLSLDLATRFFHNSEIINADKMQVYSGLDITTNKITLQERLNVPHHLLGSIDPTKSVFTASDFRRVASEVITDIKSRYGLPFIVGGSNSLIYSLVTKRYDPKSEIFNFKNPESDQISKELRYDCCFIWVDVCLPVLNQYLSKRVDEMLDSGMFEELEEFFRSGEYKAVLKSGLGQAIGVPEFEGYFKNFRRGEDGGELQTAAYDEAVRRIKDNTCQLAKKQVSKILRLRDGGWDLKRVDATEAFRAVMMAEYGGDRVAEIWEKQVVEPSMKIVKQFLDE